MSYFDELITMLEGVIPSITELPTFILMVFPVAVALVLSIAILFIIGYALQIVRGAF